VPYPQRSDVQAACSAKRATRTGLSHRSTHEPTETQTIVTGFREGARHLLDPCPKCAAPCIFSSDFSMGSQDEAAILACLLAFSPAECLRLLDEIDLLQGDVALLRAAIIQRRDWDEREPLIKTPTMTTLSDLRR